MNTLTRRPGTIVVMALLLLVGGLTGGRAAPLNGQVDFRPNGGVVVNANGDSLPHGCSAISDSRTLTVRAGRTFVDSPDDVFAYDKNEWHVEPCSKVTVTFKNRDPIRHQWMVHGLPAYIYPMGMFTLSVTGPGSVTGSFIVSSVPRTLLVHCDIPTHTERGMKGQIQVGGGSGDLPNVPGISGPRQSDPYTIQWTSLDWVIYLLGLSLGIGAFFGYRKL